MSTTEQDTPSPASRFANVAARRAREAAESEARALAEKKANQAAINAAIRWQAELPARATAAIPALELALAQLIDAIDQADLGGGYLADHHLKIALRAALWNLDERAGWRAPHWSSEPPSLARLQRVLDVTLFGWWR